MSKKKISGDLSIEDINNGIVSTEVLGAHFTGCSIIKGFNVLDFYVGFMPSRAYLVKASELPSVPNVHLHWSGKMKVEGKIIDIHLYRKSETSINKNIKGSDSTINSLNDVVNNPIYDMPILSRETAVNRALSSINSDTKYDIKNRNTPPLESSIWPQSGAKIDCSGFIAWCLRINRRTSHPMYKKFNDGWVETSALHKDGLEQSGFFVSVKQAKLGSLLVYPDQNNKHGHVGMVVSVNVGISGVNGVLQVVHCSKGNYKESGKAIMITEPKIWLKRKDSIIIDYEGFS